MIIKLCRRATSVMAVAGALLTVPTLCRADWDLTFLETVKTGGVGDGGYANGSNSGGCGSHSETKTVSGSSGTDEDSVSATTTFTYTWSGSVYQPATYECYFNGEVYGNVATSGYAYETSDSSVAVVPAGDSCQVSSSGGTVGNNYYPKPPSDGKGSSRLTVQPLTGELTVEADQYAHSKVSWYVNNGSATAISHAQVMLTKPTLAP